MDKSKSSSHDKKSKGDPKPQAAPRAPKGDRVQANKERQERARRAHRGQEPTSRAQAIQQRRAENRGDGYPGSTSPINLPRNAAQTDRIARRKFRRNAPKQVQENNSNH